MKRGEAIVKPSIGRIVHFNSSAGACAALVVHVGDELTVNLQVFHPGGAIEFMYWVPQGVAVGCWDCEKEVCCMQEQLAGNIRVAAFTSDSQLNIWLDRNPDTEIVDIQFAGFSAHGVYAQILVIYRIENQREDGK